MAKRKIKKNVKVTIILLLVLGILSFSGIKVYNEYLYRQTNEYKFLQKGYTLKEISLLEKNLTDEKISELLNLDVKNEELINLMQAKNYKNDLLERYNNYLEKNKRDISDAIYKVNLNLDYDFYGITFKSDVSLKEEILVNKYYLLDETFTPEDLTLIPSKYCWEKQYATKTVVDAYIEMWEKANEEDIYLMVNSSYRSYENQKEVYDYYVDIRNTNYADGIAARPGSSEHQTGLALDIFELHNSSTKTFHNSKAYTWLKENAYKFGFILRYKEGTENITGYNPESWHYRYVGKKLAKTLYESDITLDEYYAAN